MNEVLRQEKKYFMTAVDAQTLSGLLSQSMIEDPHNGSLGYSIRSLYFDSWNDGDFFGKVDGLELRRKIRLRIYSPGAKTAKLEMKQKEGPYQKKRSLTMGREDAQALIQGKYEVLLNYKEPFAAECFGLMQTELYRPRTIVEYRRKAFIAKENKIRITLGDRMIAYESRQYGQQRLISFYNTAATDPFSYPELVARKEQKFATLDVEQIQSTKKYRAGQFASYTVHLFSPDYLTEMEKAALCSEGEIQNRMGVLELQLLLRRIANMEAPPISAYLPANWQSGDCHYPAYFSYIKALNAYHTMPVVISEFGVTTGRGMEQAYEALGLNDGHTSEQRQGEVLANCYEDLKAAGSAGGCVFSWQDEWQKRNWNTIYATDTDNTAYWHDAQTRDQYFGLLAFDPGESRRCCVVDGNCAEWSAADQILERGGITLSAKYDEEYLYLRLHKDDLALEQDVFYLPIDVTPKSGSTFASDQHVSFERGADFLLVLNGKENTRILVQKRYELLRAAYGEVFYSYNPYENQPDGANGEFQPIWLPIELEGLLPAWSAEEDEFLWYETGKLRYGNADPQGADYDSLADFCAGEQDVELRVPWALLNFSNPAKGMVHDDYYEKYGVENLKIKEIYIGVGVQGQDTRIFMESVTLRPWEARTTYHQRLKPAYDVLRELWTNPVE